MPRIRGVVKTVMTVAGAVSLSVPITIAAAERIPQGEATQGKDHQGIDLDKGKQGFTMGLSVQGRGGTEEGPTHAL